jgi:hypothetical protein
VSFVQNFRFINGKNEASFHMKRNPRKLNWCVSQLNAFSTFSSLITLCRTLFYRRLRKKGTQEDQLKKAKKRTIVSTAATRGIQGLSIQDLAAKTDDKKKAAVKEAFTR